MLANVDDSFDDGFVEELTTLHDLGCNQFLCSGTQSEQLHDALDALLHERPDAGDVITTYHRDDEPLDDVVALFLELGTLQTSGILVFVHGNSPRDTDILSKLATASSE